MNRSFFSRYSNGTPAPVYPRLPVFVYGTLRSGHGNYYGLLSGNTVAEHIGSNIKGLSMYGKHGFPYCVSDPENMDVGVTGDIMVLDPENYDSIMEGLDMLEGYSGTYGDHNHYNRLIRMATLPTGEAVKVYVYVQAESDRERTIATREHVESGNWNDFNTPRSEAPSWA